MLPQSARNRACSVTPLNQSPFRLVELTIACFVTSKLYGSFIEQYDEMRLRGSTGWGKVKDIEPESRLPTPPVYFQVIDNVKR